MYKLVFLLMFSAANVTGAKDIKLDIDFRNKTETSYCLVKPAGTPEQILTEGEHIRFHIYTPTKLKDFWCYHGGKNVYNYEPTELEQMKIENGKMKYTLTETSIDSKSEREGNWTCTFQILKKKSIADKHESDCLFQVKVTKKPGVSLKIAQLSPLAYWNNGTKLYNYSFTEGEKAFDCVLVNPTENNETYTLSIKLDDSHETETRHPREIIKPLGKTTLTGAFMLNRTSKRIVCSATNVYGAGPNLHAEINLQYIPPPRVHLFTHGPQELKTGELFRENHTQIYHYNFTAGENVTINCALNYTVGYERNYGLKLRMKNDSCQLEGSETSISHTFSLENEDEYIYCTAYNKKAPTTDLSLPDYLYNMVHLHHTPREVAVEPALSMLISVAGSVTLLQSNDTIYHYNFTDGQTVQFNCSLNNAADFEKKYDIAFYSTLGANANPELVTSSTVLNTTTHVSYNFTLNKESKNITCAAWGDKNDTKSRIDVRLHYNPQPMPDLKFYVNGSSELDDGVPDPDNLTQIIYSYNFTDDENITVTLDVDEGNKDNYAMEFYLDGNLYDLHGNISSRDPKAAWSGTSSKKMTRKRFMLKKHNKKITCVVRNKNNNNRVQTRIVNLTYKKPESASGTNLTMEGLPDNSCNFTDIDIMKLNQICNYNYNQSRNETPLHLKCILRGAESNSDWTIKFGTKEDKGAFKDEKSVSYVIKLSSKNETVKCTATKANPRITYTIDVNANYIPQTTTITTLEPPTDTAIQPTTPPLQGSQPAGEDETSSSFPIWVTYVLVGGALLIIICVVGGCLVIHRQKKPPPADSTYANLTKDQKGLPTPMPTARNIQKTNDAQKQNAARKPNVTLDNNYSVPKDSQDMSEALYADPNRFVGDSSNYAEPYAAKPSPPSNTYAEPYKANYAEPYPGTSEGNYAELNLPNSSGKELYARPVPKAQRTPKVKEDCNYSNIFGGQYGNTKK